MNLCSALALYLLIFLFFLLFDISMLIMSNFLFFKRRNIEATGFPAPVIYKQINLKKTK